MNSKMKHLPIVMYSILLASMIFFSFQRHKKPIHKAVELVFETQTPLYLDTDLVDKLLIQKKDSASLQLKDMVALSKVENAIKAFPEVENAEVYQKIDGSLSIYIQERRPVVRIFDGEGYYLDRMGVGMPLSKKHSPNVPLFFGSVDSLQTPQLLYLLRTIEADAYLDRQVIHIEEEKGEFVLGLRDFSTRFELGDLTQLNGKIKKLKTLCAYLKQEQMEHKYTNINFNYKQQAVAIE